MRERQAGKSEFFFFGAHVVQMKQEEEAKQKIELICAAILEIDYFFPKSEL